MKRATPFLLFSFTAPYAASQKQPIFSGCFWEAAVQQITYKAPLHNYHFVTTAHSTYQEKKKHP
jgi:hypothetical protein